jgi:hypothetical protein
VDWLYIHPLHACSNALALAIGLYIYIGQGLLPLINRAAALGLLTPNRLPYTALASFCFCTATAACAAVAFLLLSLLLPVAVIDCSAAAAAFSALRACCSHTQHEVIARMRLNG